MMSAIDIAIVIDTYKSMIERAKRAGKRKVADQKEWAFEATKSFAGREILMTRKYLDMQTFLDEGFLQEANRLFFHPLGLALEVTVEDDGQARISGVWDYRDDPEGIFFAELSLEKAQRVAALRESKVIARSQACEGVEWGVQPIRAQP